MQVQDKAYLDGSFDNAYKQFIKQFDDNIEAFFKYPHNEDFRAQMEKNDLNWIIDFKEEHRKIVLPMLREELGLDTFGL